MSLERSQRRSLGLMAGVIVGLHALGFFVLFAGHGRALLIGTGLTAYTLGLRHAFDADHISAIDNTTRRLMAEGKRPLSVGFWFSLGHSSVVFVLSFAVALGVRAVGPHSALHAVAGYVGTGVSGTFLYIIAGLNLAILWEIIQVFAAMRGGTCDEATLERRLADRGLMNRWFGRAVAKPWHMYPVGLLFGLGFDTASEVALLLLAAGAAGAGLPFYAILCLPVLFTAGMSLLDTIDGSFMNFAYGWAFSQPARKVFYNLTVTGLSVAVALVIGTVELVGVFSSSSIDMGTLGLIVAGMFLATWVGAVLVWRLGRLEQRFGARE